MTILDELAEYDVWYDWVAEAPNIPDKIFNSIFFPLGKITFNGVIENSLKGLSLHKELISILYKFSPLLLNGKNLLIQPENIM